MLGRRLLQSTKLLNCLPSKLILGGRTTPETAGFAARCFSGVVNLSDEKAVHKFRMLNHKSVLYFTANWCGRKSKLVVDLWDQGSAKVNCIIGTSSATIPGVMNVDPSPESVDRVHEKCKSWLSLRV